MYRATAAGTRPSIDRAAARRSRISVEEMSGVAASTRNMPVSTMLIDAILYRGEIPRGEVPAVLGVSERTANRVVAGLTEQEVLTSQTPKAPLRITFPAKLASSWMPGLFPEQRR